MEIIVFFVAIYLIAKVGWPIIKFLIALVGLAMVVQSCSMSRAEPMAPVHYGDVR